jgi:hypothetical protein
MKYLSSTGIRLTMESQLKGEFLSTGDVSLTFKNENEITIKDGGWRPATCDKDGIIWRYRTLDRYKSILEDQYLWFARPDQFDDPFEGSIPRKNIEERMKKYD